MGAITISWIVQRQPDLTMMLSGCLAGLVGITAGADVIGAGHVVFHYIYYLLGT